MSKKITHKEHRQLLSELYKKQGGKWIYQADAYIKQQEKQEKLLELYRQLVKDLGLVIEHDTTDTWDGPEDYEYLEINCDSIKALNTYKQIKELEK